MILKKWSEIPECIKNNKTKEYYDVLNKKQTSLTLKRLLDIIFSIILLIILFPIFIILGIAIKLESKGPVFYRQERVTQYGKVFRIFKFRTMVQGADKIGSLVTIENDNRITKIGKIIRKLRLDEIPQLINVLKGEMTFVGTRPEVKKYVEEYNDEMKATLLLPAGITSEASIQYKDEDVVMSKYRSKQEDVDYIYINRILPQKMKWNLGYVKEFSVFKDIQIAVKTVFAVLKINRQEIEILNEEVDKKEVVTK